MAVDLEKSDGSARPSYSILGPASVRLPSSCTRALLAWIEQESGSSVTVFDNLHSGPSSSAELASSRSVISVRRGEGQSTCSQAGQWPERAQTLPRMRRGPQKTGRNCSERVVYAKEPIAGRRCCRREFSRRSSHRGELDRSTVVALSRRKRCRIRFTVAMPAVTASRSIPMATSRTSPSTDFSRDVIGRYVFNGLDDAWPNLQRDAERNSGHHEFHRQPFNARLHWIAKSPYQRRRFLPQHRRYAVVISL